MTKGNRTCERCGQIFATPQKLRGHLNRKFPCIARTEQQLTPQTTAQTTTQTTAQSRQSLQSIPQSAAQPTSQNTQPA
ncbi:hypothetical protein RhiirC2_802912, partial [Rhizophagus irregularis]